MFDRSHIPNERASPFVRTCPADFGWRRSYKTNVARRGIPTGPITWYLREWMASVGMEGRGAQSKMMKLTGWSKATMSQLYNGEQDYSPAILATAAKALHAEPFELLMHPDRAMRMRRFRETAVELAHAVEQEQGEADTAAVEADRKRA